MPYSGALRIALVAPPLERVPPRAYGGTERIVHELVLELDRRGHNVTLFASGDSEPPANGQLIATVGEALRPTGFGGDASPYFYSTILDVLHRADEFDLIHAHLDWPGILLAHVSPTPVINTFHGRIDFPFAGRLFEDAPRGLVAISRAQAHLCPEVPWEAVVHNGLNLADAPFERRAGEELCFVGRIAPEKGVVDAIEVARLAGRKLRIAAKIGPRPDERAYYENVFMPEGEPFRRAWRDRTSRLRPLVLLLDVSGSMGPYARALMQFAYAAMAAGGRYAQTGTCVVRRDASST